MNDLQRLCHTGQFSKATWAQPIALHAKGTFASSRDILLHVAVTHCPQENVKKPDKLMKFLNGDCLELVACKFPGVTWPFIVLLVFGKM